MISAFELAQVFLGMLGWPYASPGYNDKRGLDCSGAFVYAYRQFDASIYHGSNRIVRRYCHDVRKRSLSELQTGMAIFKSRSDTSGMKAEYKPGGSYYDPALPDDYYHIGLVVSVNPLQIVNATPPQVRIDTKLDQWCCAGYLNAVSYNKEPDKETGAAIVTAPSGSTVNLRQSPSKSSALQVRVPIGTQVEILETVDDQWARVLYERREIYTGYMMRQFLNPDP